MERQKKCKLQRGTIWPIIRRVLQLRWRDSRCNSAHTCVYGSSAFVGIITSVLLLTLSRLAFAAESLPRAVAPLVLIVPTRGSASWLAAERRLEAELRGLQLRVAYDQVVRAFDATLPERARFAQAMVAIQVMREGDLGILRFWFTQQPGRQSGYQHLELNLRNADVVSRAVLPVVEAIFDRVEAPAGERRNVALAAQKGTERALERDDSSSAACHRRKALRCAPVVAGRLLLGPYLASATPGAALAVGAGLRWRMLSMLTLEGDADYQILSKGVDDPRVTYLEHQTAVAVHLLYEFRNRVGRGVALGPGIGALIGTHNGETLQLPRASLRTEMFIPLGARSDLTIATTVAQAWGLPAGMPHNGFSASAMLAFDLNFN